MRIAIVGAGGAGCFAALLLARAGHESRVAMYSEWLDALDPITDVYPMGGVHNTMRRLTAGGKPVATGLAAIGDSVCATNPTLGRGLTLALSGAADLLETLDEHPDDWTAQALAMDARVTDHVLPYYADQSAIDSARLAMLRHTIFGAPVPAPPPLESNRVTFAQLRIAAQFDATAFRGFWRLMGMISLPDDIYRDPSIVASTLGILRQTGRAG